MRCHRAQSPALAEIGIPSTWEASTQTQLERQDTATWFLGTQEMPQASPLACWYQWPHLWKSCAGWCMKQPSGRATGSSKQEADRYGVWSPKCEWVSSWGADCTYSEEEIRWVSSPRPSDLYSSVREECSLDGVYDGVLNAAYYWPPLGETEKPLLWKEKGETTIGC